MFSEDGQSEDVRMGRTLSHSAIFVDTQDELQQQRFFPIKMFNLVKVSENPLGDYYLNYTYYNVSNDGLRCCSDVSIGFHYTKPKEMHSLDYFIYKVYPFGSDKNLTEKFPRKLKLNEIIKASDRKVYTPNFRDHIDYHNMTSSEMIVE